ncbi:ABC transporter substrate-binding protein [Bradyrhizobium sp. HKCCYLRH3099]|uniref:ABC transporter substrate-binding protein n=1 Tax=unclassified Bradyrhizobium TaxID=2631580 RepID=UPI003EB6FDDE
MAFIRRRDVLRALAAGGMAMSPLGRRAVALECGKPEPKDHIIIGKQTSGVSGFDPHLNASAPAAEIIGNLYETLVTLKQGKPDPFLSLALWQEPNGASWTFAIKSGWRFASGKPIKAKDVAFSFRRAVKLNRSPAHPLAHLGLTAINVDRRVSTDKDNPYILRIKLPEAVEKDIVLHCLTSACCAVLDSVLVTQHFAPNPDVPVTCAHAPFQGAFTPIEAPDICEYDPLDAGRAWLRFNSAGSGPFIVRNAQRTDEIVLQPNDLHSDYGKSSKPLIVRAIPDPREQRRLLQCGEIQVAWDTTVPPKEQDRKGGKAKETKPPTDLTLPHPRANLLLLCMNVMKKPFGDPEVRKGIRQAIDSSKFETPRWKAQHRFFPSAIGGFDFPITTPPQDPLAKAALENQKGALKLDYLVGAGRSAVANGLAWQLAKAGIGLELIPASTGVIFQERLAKRDFELALVSLSSDYLHPHSNAHALGTHYEREEFKAVDGKTIEATHTLAWYCHWRDDEIMNSIANAAKASGPAVQKTFYESIQDILMKRGPYAFLLEETVYVEGVKGLLPELGALDNQTRFSPPKPT